MLATCTRVHINTVCVLAADLLLLEGVLCLLSEVHCVTPCDLDHCATAINATKVL
jgi:hypothetical protein